MGSNDCDCPGSEQVVMFESPVAIEPLFRSFALTALSQNITAVHGIDSLTLGEEYRLHNQMNVKENHRHARRCTSELTHLLQSWGLRALISLLFLPLCYKVRWIIKSQLLK